MAITKATASSVAPAAKGDLVVGSGTNDAAVLAVGSANQVLTVDSSTGTGLKWAAPATGGGMTLLATTTLSSTTVTVSSINQDYKHLLVIFRGIHSNNGTFAIRTNGITTANYYYANDEVGFNLSFACTWQNGGTEFLYSENIPSDANNCGYIWFYDYSNTGAAMKFSESKIYTDEGEILGFAGVNRSINNVALDSITYFSPSGGTIVGTALLYGVS